MKKLNLILSTLMVLTIVFALAGCSPKTPTTAENFTETMEKADFEVTDVTETTDSNGLATAIIVATKDDLKLEFWELTDSETADDIFYQNKSNFTDSHPVQTMSKSTTYQNYDYYSFLSDGDFHLITRIDNTMLYCEIDESDKDEILELVKELGYR